MPLKIEIVDRSGRPVKALKVCDLFWHASNLYMVIARDHFVSDPGSWETVPAVCVPTGRVVWFQPDDKVAEEQEACLVRKVSDYEF